MENNLDLIREDQQRIIDKWSVTKLFDDIKDEHVKLQCATLAENQRLFNEAVDHGDTLFRRLNIPFVRRIYDHGFIPYQMVSVQAMMGPTQQGFYINKYGRIAIKNLSAKTKKMESFFPVIQATPPADGIDDDQRKPEGALWLGGAKYYYIVEEYAHRFDKLIESTQIQLDAEAELTNVVVNDIQEEFTREVFTDLTKIAASKLDHYWKSGAHFVDAIRLASNQIERKVGKAATWALMSESRIIHLMEEEIDFELHKDYENLGIRRYGTLENKIAVFVDPKYPEDKCLLGHFGTHFDSGYVLAPYVPLAQTPVVLDPVEFRPRRGLLTRYDKCMIPEGDGYYATISIT